MAPGFKADICLVPVPLASDCFDFITLAYHFDEDNVLAEKDIVGFKVFSKNKTRPYLLELDRVTLDEILEDSGDDLSRGVPYVIECVTKSSLIEHSLKDALKAELALSNARANEAGLGENFFAEYDWNEIRDFNIKIIWSRTGHTPMFFRPKCERKVSGSWTPERGYIRMDQDLSYLVNQTHFSVCMPEDLPRGKNVKSCVASTSIGEIETLADNASCGVYNVFQSNCHHHLKRILRGLKKHSFVEQLKECRLAKWLFKVKSHRVCRARRAVSVRRPDRMAWGALFGA